MTLRRKTLIIAGSTLIGLVLVLYIIANYFMMSNFAKLEEQSTRRNVQRALNATSDSINFLDKTVSDWASWDDTYNFIAGENDSYIKKNLVDQTFELLRINLIAFFDTSGKVVYSKYYDLANNMSIPSPDSLSKHLLNNKIFLVNLKQFKSIKGFIILPEGPFLVASQPILTSEDKGPARGTLIMGRYLDQTEIKRLSETTNLSLTFQKYEASTMPEDFNRANLVLSNGTQVFIQNLNPQLIAGYTLIENIYGIPCMVLRVDQPREIYMQGKASMFYFILCFLASGLILGSIILLLVEKMVLSRLEKLSNSAQSIERSTDSSARIELDGKDELTNLAGAINNMLTALEHSQLLIKNSEERYRQLFDEAITGDYIFERDGEIVLCNAAFIKIIGFNTIEEAIGTNISEVFLKKEDWENVARLIQEKEKVEFSELELVRSDGQIITVMLKVTGKVRGRDKSFYYQGYLFDITDLKKSQENTKSRLEMEETIAHISSRFIGASNFDDAVNSSLVDLARISGADRTYLVTVRKDIDGMDKTQEWPHCDASKDTLIKSRSEIFSAWLGILKEKKIIYIEDVAQLPEGNQKNILTARNVFSVLLLPVCTGEELRGLIGIENIKEIQKYSENNFALFRTFSEIIGSALVLKDSQEALSASERVLSTVFNSVNDAIFIHDLDGKIINVNDKAFKMFGANRNQIISYFIGDFLKIENSKVRLPELWSKVLSGEDQFFEGKARRPNDSSIFDAEIYIGMLVLGNRTFIMVTVRDITERKQVEELFNTLANYTPSSVYLISEGKFEFVNPAFIMETGYSKEELMGKESIKIVLEEDREKTRDSAIKMLKGERSFPYEYKYVSKNGRVGWRMEKVASVQYKGKRTVLGNSMDVTEFRKMEERLKYLSIHDPLTGLYNRAYFEEEMRRLEEGRHSSTSVIVCDVDALKLVNDVLGHNVGDEVLKSTADAIRSPFRASDVVARIGGDEFAVLLPDCDVMVADKACRRIAHYVKLYNQENPVFPLSISVGYAVRKGSSPGMTEIFKEADKNMYREKLLRSRIARKTIALALIKKLEERGLLSEGQISRMQELVSSLAQCIGLPEHSISEMRLFAQFYDLGKISIPEQILCKPGPLTIEETAEMRQHCEIGQRITQSVPDLLPISDWVLKHHEWWNGQGYPLKLKGEEIPVQCRIIAIAEAFEAMTNDHPYRKAMSVEKALEEIKNCSGIQFDPALVEIFLQIIRNKNK
ncbi:MAG: Putative PAS/PAC sensor protein [Desulfotomaculum sp. 46_296]|nr:MAG: Putative PAS/PAC sensor protein [Desulfotomaculum sp. 46_296]HAU32119.1 hypothetical protein [Desulfotomaculum sp.]